MNLRVVTGALFAIVAAVVVTVLIAFNIPHWLFEVIRQGPTERAIYALTPELVIVRCGAPISDNTQSHPGPQNIVMVFREMDYHSGTGPVTLAFGRTDQGTQQGRWVLNAMDDSVGHFRYDTAKSKLGALPCLAGK